MHPFLNQMPRGPVYADLADAVDGQCVGCAAALDARQRQTNGFVTCPDPLRKCPMVYVEGEQVNHQVMVDDGIHVASKLPHGLTLARQLDLLARHEYQDGVMEPVQPSEIPFNKGEDVWYVAVEDWRVQGYARVLDLPNRPHLHSLMVLPRYRRRGIAPKLLRHVLDIYKPLFLTPDATLWSYLWARGLVDDNVRLLPSFNYAHFVATEVSPRMQGVELRQSGQS